MLKNLNAIKNLNAENYNYRTLLKKIKTGIPMRTTYERHKNYIQLL